MSERKKAFIGASVAIIGLVILMTVGIVLAVVESPSPSNAVILLDDNDKWIRYDGAYAESMELEINSWDELSVIFGGTTGEKNPVMLKLKNTNWEKAVEGIARNSSGSAPYCINKKIRIYNDEGQTVLVTLRFDFGKICLEENSVKFQQKKRAEEARTVQPKVVRKEEQNVATPALALLQGRLLSVKREGKTNVEIFLSAIRNAITLTENRTTKIVTVESAV